MATGEIAVLCAADYEALIAFLNGAFGYTNRRTGFEALMPAFLRPTDASMGRVYVIRDQGRILASASIFPIRWWVGGQELLVAGVANVGVDPACRGQGHMQRIMEHLVVEMRRQGYPVSWLWGQRQRYGYFGYEVAGTGLRVSVGPANLKHLDLDHEPILLTLDPAEDGLEQARAMHLWAGLQPIYAERDPADFLTILRHWFRQPLVARSEAGTVMGYAVVDEGCKQVMELVVRDRPTLYGMLDHLMERNGGAALSIDLPALPQFPVDALVELSEQVSVVEAGNWQILDWPVTLTALLKARHSLVPNLPAGVVTLRVNGHHQSLQLRVEGRSAVCHVTDDAPDLVADASKLTRMLLGPLRPSLVDPTIMLTGARLLDAWCPLPAWIPPQDHV